MKSRKMAKTGFQDEVSSNFFEAIPNSKEEASGFITDSEYLDNLSKGSEAEEMMSIYGDGGINYPITQRQIRGFSNATGKKAGKAETNAKMTLNMNDSMKAFKKITILTTVAMGIGAIWAYRTNSSVGGYAGKILTLGLVGTATGYIVFKPFKKAVKDLSEANLEVDTKLTPETASEKPNSSFCGACSV